MASGRTGFIFCIFFMWVMCGLSFSQNNRSDLELLKRKVDGTNEQTAAAPANSKARGIGNFLLTVYQKNISLQISAECIFNPSCSKYSRLCINKYGLLEGILATGDRLTRCSGFSARDIPEYKFGADDLANELPR